MHPTLVLTRKYPLGTTGVVNVYLPVALTDTLNGGTTPKSLKSARLTQNTGGGYAEVSVPGVVSTLYPHSSADDAYVVWQEDLMYQGAATNTLTAYQTPVTTSKDIDDPTGPLYPLYAGDIHYGIGGVEVNGAGLAASVYLGKLILQLQGNPDAVTIGAAAQVDDNDLVVSSIPTNMSKTGGTWAIIEPFTANCEIRRITGVTGSSLNFDRPMKIAHDLDKPVMFSGDPEWIITLFGAAGGGTVDDTPAFNAAKSDLPVGGGVIKIPRGVWAINGVMNVQGMRVFGEAKSSMDETFPSFIVPYDTDEPVLKLMGTAEGQVHDMLVRDVALYGNDEAATGLEITSGAYNCHLDHFSCINFVGHCLKIGDINQTDLVSKIHINGAVLQGSGSSDDSLVTLGLYGNGGSNYTTAVFINNMELQQTTHGKAIVCDGAPNNYISNSYIQLRNLNDIQFKRTGGRSFPHIFMDGVAIDNGDSAANPDSVSIELIAGNPLLPTYISGTYKIVGKITDGTHTYDAPDNMAAGLRDPLLLEGWVLGAMRFTDLATPEFTSAANIQVSNRNFQVNTFGGGHFYVRPGNRDDYALRVLYGLGPVVPSFVSTAMPVADTFPGAINQVFNTSTGSPMMYSTPRTQTLMLTGAPTGGYFTLTVQVNADAAQTTTNLSYNASNADLQLALQTLTNVGANNMTVRTISGGWVLTPGGPLLGQTITITSDVTHLTGGTSPNITVTTTPGVWHQFGSRNLDNAYLVGQGVRAALSPSVAVGLYVPWITGDTQATAFFGRNDPANDQAALRGMSGSNFGVWAESLSGDGLFAKSGTGVPIRASAYTDSPNGVVLGARLTHRALSGTAGAGNGVGLRLDASTDNGGLEHIDDPIYGVEAFHPRVAYSTYSGRVQYYMYEFGTKRLFYDVIADNGLKQAWNGNAPVGKQSLTALATDPASTMALVNALAQGLINYGLFATASGFSAPDTETPFAGEIGESDQTAYVAPSNPSDNADPVAALEGTGGPEGDVADTPYVVGDTD